MDFFFFKQKTAYEMRISDWSSDVCSSDLAFLVQHAGRQFLVQHFLDDRRGGVVHRLAAQEYPHRSAMHAKPRDIDDVHVEEGPEPCKRQQAELRQMLLIDGVEPVLFDQVLGPGQFEYEGAVIDRKSVVKGKSGSV